MRVASLPLPLVLALLVGSIGAGCATTAARKPSATVYRGIYAHAFEQSDFTPTGSAETWWLTGDLGRLTASFAYVRWQVAVEGELNASGHYGHLGACQRELRITRVLEAYPTDAGLR